MDEKGKFELNKTGLLAYSHGEYLGLGKKLGTFGYSVRKKLQLKEKKRSRKKSGSSGKAVKTRKPASGRKAGR